MSLLTLRIFLILGIVGHTLNYWCDRVLSITPNGRITIDTMKDINDESKMASLFKGVNSDIPFKSAMLGTLALVLEFFGYFSIAFYVWNYSKILGTIMFAAAAIFTIFGSGHHVKYGLGVWIFIKGGLDKKSYSILNELYNKFPITKLAYAGYFIYIIILMTAICMGVCNLAIWSLVFTVLPVFLVLSPFKIIGTLHISSVITFIGWLFII